jgi:two-component system response regulator MprA
MNRPSLASPSGLGRRGAPQSDAAASAFAPPAGASGQSPPLVLVADDDPAIRRRVRAALEGAGYAVATVATGAAVLAWLAEGRSALVVLDVGMPAPDGWEVLRRVRGTDRRGGRVPVVVLLDRTIDRLKAFGAGADHYLLKPFGPDEVVARVAAVLPRPAEAARDGAAAPDAESGAA